MAELRCGPRQSDSRVNNVIHYAVTIPPSLVEEGLEQKYLLNTQTVLLISIEKKFC